jgi:hypothetical protein
MMSFISAIFVLVAISAVSFAAGYSLCEEVEKQKG